MVDAVTGPDTSTEAAADNASSLGSNAFNMMFEFMLLNAERERQAKEAIMMAIMDNGNDADGNDGRQITFDHHA